MVHIRETHFNKKKEQRVNLDLNWKIYLTSSLAADLRLYYVFIKTGRECNDLLFLSVMLRQYGMFSGLQLSWQREI